MRKTAGFLVVLILFLAGAVSALAIDRSRNLQFRLERGVRVHDGVSSNTIKLDDGTYRMYYTGEGIRVIDSTNGKDFTNDRQVLNQTTVAATLPTVTQISNSAIFKLDDGTWRMIFEGKSGTGTLSPRRLYSATSTDGVNNFSVEAGVRLEDSGTGDTTFTSVPDVVELDDGRLRMYYTAGLKSKSAVSSDEGLNWTKEGFIHLNKRTSTLVDPDVTKVGSKYILLFSTMPVAAGGTPSDELQKIYRAFSTDGRHFKFAGLKIALSQANAMDPDMVRRGSGKRLRIYFSRMRPAAANSDILSALYR